MYAKKFLLWLIEWKKTLVLKPKPKINRNNKGYEDLVIIKTICYNYNECRKAVTKMIILDEPPFNFIEN